MDKVSINVSEAQKTFDDDTLMTDDIPQECLELTFLCLYVELVLL